MGLGGLTLGGFGSLRSERGWGVVVGIDDMVTTIYDSRPHDFTKLE